MINNKLSIRMITNNKLSIKIITNIKLCVTVCTPEIVDFQKVDGKNWRKSASVMPPLGLVRLGCYCQ